MADKDDKRPPAAVVGNYPQKSVKDRIEAFFLDNLGKVVTREQILEVAKDKETGEEPENWHQRLSELRTDSGYTILSSRDRTFLAVGEYMMPNAKKSKLSGKRVKPTPSTWAKVLEKADYKCEWHEGCGLKDDDIDPIGGGTVRLTPDHKTPHSMDPNCDPENPDCWQALCGRHQVMKKNYWDSTTGKLNVLAIVQAASTRVKRQVYSFLKKFFGDND